MKDVEKILYEKGKDFDDIKAPDIMETRLRNALETKKTTRNNYRKIISIVAVFFMVFSILNFDTLAYIGKRFFGYDEILSDNLEQLNELGKGQTIGKYQKISDDITVYLDGIMLDDTQLLVFYRIVKDNGKIDELNTNVPFIYSKFDVCYHQHSTGQLNDNKTEISYVASYETPGIFDKNFDFEGTIEYEDEKFEYDIKFKLNRNKAVGKTVKLNLYKKINIGSTNIYVKKLIISPTQTIIKGNLVEMFDFAKDVISGDKRRYSDIDIKLLVNGDKEINSISRGISSSMKGIEFDCKYESLPKNIESLEMIIEKVKVYNKIDKEIKVSANYKTLIDGQYFEIINILTQNNKTYITVKSEEGTQFLDVSLFANSTELIFDRTIEGDYEKILDEEVKIYYTRTFVYKGKGDNLKMNIGSIYYNKKIGKKFKLLTK